jgi:hypothetical protein
MPERDSTDRRHLANVIAMVIRNAMQDFHVKHLSDGQMRGLNPIIRNAVYTALQALDDAPRSENARQFLGFHAAMIPSYWEPPELLDDYRRTTRRKHKGSANPNARRRP